MGSLSPFNVSKKNCVQASSSSNLDITNELDSNLTADDIESPIILEEDRDVYFDETLGVSIILMYKIVILITQNKFYKL